MPSPTTTRGLLRHFPRVADLPANDQHANTPPVRSPTSSSLQAILAAGAGGRSAWGGASDRMATREVGGGVAGEAESEGCSWESGGSNATSNAGTEEDEEEHAPLTALPWVPPAGPCTPPVSLSPRFLV